MPEYRIKVARTTIEEFIVHAKDDDHLQEKWPDAIGVSDAVESYSDGDDLLSFVDEDADRTVVNVRPETSTFDKMLAMLDRLHQRFHENELVVRPGPDDPDLDVDDLMNEIGCLIAEAKGEYVPETN